jgi:isopentenyl-diphosphate delta-isomerase
MGFDCTIRPAFPLRYRAEFDNGLIENEYDHVFVGTYDGPVNPNPDEVAEYQWVRADALRSWLADSPDDFTVWFRLAVERAIAAYESGEY